MTQQASEPAVGGESTVDPQTDAINTFEDIARDMLPDEQEEELPIEGDEPEAELDDIADEEEADDLPPIDAPVSLSAEDREIFKTLPREGQEIFAKRVGELEKGFHQKAQEAARARQEVEQEAYQQLAAYDRSVSQQLQEYAQRFEVPEPDMALLATDPHTYALQAKRYQDATAQRTQAQQQAQAYAQQAQQREAYAEQVREAEEHRIIVEQFPEYADPTTGPKLREQLTAVAKELGYPPELIGQARATDIIAMRKVAELKAKADKYDALNAKNMVKVRAAKGLPKVATPGVSQGSEQVRAQRASAAWEVAKSAKSRSAKDDALADWMKNTGWL